MDEQAFIDWLGRGQDFPTPAYVYTESSLVHAAKALRALLPASARVFYSLKANPQPAVVRSLADLGIGAEVASERERQIAGLAAVPANNVLVGGVCKSIDLLRAVVRQGTAAIVVDSTAEWARLSTVLAPAGTRPGILLRINPGVSLGGLDMGGTSQFGMSVPDGLHLAQLIAADGRAELLGLHAYLGSQRLNLEPVLRTVDLVGSVITEFRRRGHAPRVVDIGFGLGVPYLSRDDELPRDELRVLLQERWCAEPWRDVSLWSEAGRTLVARSGYFVARVLETKSLHGQHFAMLDGGLNVHNPGLGVGRVFRSNPRFLFPGHENVAAREWQIVGNLCTSADCIGRKVPGPDLRAGDLVVIPNSGAYCQTTALWGFNSQTPCGELLCRLDGTLQVLVPQHELFTAGAAEPR
jgi:diaminopimelate decarboxylase